jgi:hypothetical protein
MKKYAATAILTLLAAAHADAQSQNFPELKSGSHLSNVCFSIAEIRPQATTDPLFKKIMNECSWRTGENARCYKEAGPLFKTYSETKTKLFAAYEKERGAALKKYQDSGSTPQASKIYVDADKSAWRLTTPKKRRHGGLMSRRRMRAMMR